MTRLLSALSRSLGLRAPSAPTLSPNVVGDWFGAAKDATSVRRGMTNTPGGLMKANVATNSAPGSNRLTGGARRFSNDVAGSPLAPAGQARSGRRRLVALLAVLTATAGLSLPSLLASGAPTYTFTVNNSDFGGPDANKGDGVCETATGNGICTLRAAIEESNALNRPAGDVVINVSQSINPNTDMTGSCNTATTNMLSTSINRQDAQGSQFVVSAPVTIDLGHQLRPYCVANDTSLETAMFYLTGSDITIQNFDYAHGTGTSFVVGATAQNITIDGDTLGMNGGYGLNESTTTWFPERFVMFIQGAQNVTVRNIKTGGFYNSADGGVFLFVNTAGSAPATPTTNIVIDNVQVYNSLSSTTCSSSNGAGCVTNFVTFWSGGNTGDSGFIYNVINGLTFNNLLVQNINSSMKGLSFADTVTTSANTASSDITNLTITNSRFLNNANISSAASGAFVMLPYAGYLHGTSLIANNVFISTTAATANAGTNTAIFFLGAEPAGSTKASGLTIANNYFNGYGGAQGTVRLRQAGLVTVTGNTFGAASKSNANATEETGDQNVQLSLAPTVGAPYLSSNQGVLPWYPSSTNAAVPTGAVPAGVSPLTTVPDNGLPTCPAVVTVTKPTAGTTYNTVPADPVTLDVFWTASQTSEVYLGQVTGLTGPSATLALPLPVGTLTLPDGKTVTPVNPATGVATGYVRLQTQVQGMSQLESSQYSRVVPVAGNCAPVLTINQAATATDPSAIRALHFTLTSSAPLEPSSVTAGAFTISATAVTQTYDPARLNPQIVSVTPVGSDGMTFDVVARVDDSAVVTVSVPVGAVTATCGLSNLAPSTSTDNSITYLNPIRVTPVKFPLVTGEPDGKTFTIDLLAGAPPPDQALQFVATVSQPVGTPPLTLNDEHPSIAIGETSSGPVTVVAAPGAAVAGTPTSIALELSSTDPNYNGLVLPSVTPYLYSVDPRVTITKTAYVQVADTSTPAQIEATGVKTLDGSKLTEGQTVCFVYTVTNTSADDWATVLTNVVVTDTDTRLGAGGVIGTIPTLPLGQFDKLSACTVMTAVDTTVPS